MNPQEIIESATWQARHVAEQIASLNGKFSVDERMKLRRELQTDIKRLDALVTLIETDC